MESEENNQCIQTCEQKKKKKMVYDRGGEYYWVKLLPHS